MDKIGEAGAETTIYQTTFTHGANQKGQSDPKLAIRLWPDPRVLCGQDEGVTRTYVRFGSDP
jgi:hypothetical protein